MVLAVVPGCALVDAAGGGGSDDGDPGCPADDSSCSEACPVETFLGEAPLQTTIEACGSLIDLDSDACSVGSLTATVVDFSVPMPGMYTICATTPGGSDVFVSAQCTHHPADVNYQCVAASGTCTTLFLDGGQFLYWQGVDVGKCGSFDVSIQPVDMPSGEICLDGVDNDDNGLTDCEDPGCFGPGSGCSTGLGEGVCDRIDQDTTPPFPPGTVDELACACVNDSGCDQVGPGPEGGLEPWICHQRAGGDASGVCGPRCDVDDWCGLAGLTCTPGGLCQ